jgi:hypothetical protein
MRKITAFPDNVNCQTYTCSDCDWRFDVRLYDGSSAEFWTAAREFEKHDCTTNREAT